MKIVNHSILKFIVNMAQFQNAKYRDFIDIKCSVCNKIFKTLKRDITSRLRYSKHNNCVCSNQCRAKAITLSIPTTCKNCGKTILRSPHKINSNNFCTQSCFASYNNTHKTHGYRRSKLEMYIEKQLKIEYPQLEVKCNNVTTINNELDIYIPSLKLAFELNGIFHYEPIYSEESFKKLQNRDKQKLIKCYEHGIELVIIDTSNQKKFTEASSQKYYTIVKELIDKNIKRISNGAPERA